MPKTTLITIARVREILPFVSVSGIYRGAKGTNVLTRFPHGLFSEEERLELRDRIIEKGLAERDKKIKRLRPRQRRQFVAQELI